ncbi:hypothetical protein ACU70A_06475 [Syntrophomonas erecta subsp. sporosyntropha]
MAGKEGRALRIKCISCRFAKVDKAASEKNWTAYECGNSESEYYRALLNVTPNGDKNTRISWSGCAYGERKNRSL